MNLTDLEPGELQSLTEILMLGPTDNDPIHYSNRIKASIDALPGRLKADGLFMRIVRQSMLGEKPDELHPLDQRGPLCALHHKLNAVIIKQVFTLLALEVGANLNHLARKQDLLNEDQRRLITRLRGLHAIWYEPHDYEMFFDHKVEATKWSYQGNRCAACSLARIAGDQQSIFDLICATASRVHSHSVKKPRLYQWLNSWLSHHSERSWPSEKDLLWLIGQNETMTDELKRVRKSLARRRDRHNKATTKAGSENLPPAQKPDDRQETPTHVYEFEHVADDELLSVNTHAALLSTPHLPDMSRFSQVENHNELRSIREDDQEYIPARTNWRTDKPEASVPKRASSRRSYTTGSATPTPRKSESRKSYRDDNAAPSRTASKKSKTSPRPVYPDQATDKAEDRPKYRSADLAAASYANILPKANPFESRPPQHGPPAVKKEPAPSILRPPAAQAKINPEQDSVWTDCPAPVSRRPSIDSFISRYANHGGLPVPPDCVHDPPHKKKAAMPPPPRPPDLPLRRALSNASTSHPKEKPRKPLTAGDLVKRAKSTKTRPEDWPRNTTGKRKHRPSPLKIDHRRPENLPAIDLVKRAASKSKQLENAGRRVTTDAPPKAPAPLGGRSISRYSDTLPSSPLPGRECGRERESVRGKPGVKKRSIEAESGPGTRWSMGGWKEQVANRPENKFYKDRLEKEENDKKQKRRG